MFHFVEHLFFCFALLHYCLVSFSYSQPKKKMKKSFLIPFLFLDDGKGFRIVQNGSRQERMSST